MLAFNGTLYDIPFCPWHTAALPVIAPGAGAVGLTVILKLDAPDVPQLLVAVTLSVPDVAPAPKETLLVGVAVVALKVAPAPE